MEQPELAAVRGQFDAMILLLREATAAGDEVRVHACISALAALHLQSVRLIDAERIQAIS
jgi:hypothetical protein